MGCLGVGLAALLALAVPASIARSSLAGAYVVIAVLCAAAAAVAWAAGRRPTPAGRPTRTATAMTRIGVLTVVYAVVVTVIHGAG